MAEHEHVDTTKSIWFRSSISWGAIFGGWLFAYAFALLLYLLGAAIGVTSLAAINRFNTGVTVAAGIWMIASWVIATFAGAVFAGRMAGFTNRGTGIMHGVLVWALSGLMTLLIGSVQAGAVAAAGAGAVAGTAQTVQQAGAASGQIQVPQEIRQSFITEFKQRAGAVIAQASGATNITQQEVTNALNQLDSQTLTTFSAQMIRGQTEQARQTLAQNTDLSQQEISSLVSGFSQTAQQYLNRLPRTAAGVAEQIGDVSSIALWVFFLSSLLGLGAGAWGGAVGSTMTAHAYEHGDYEPHATFA